MIPKHPLSKRSSLAAAVSFAPFCATGVQAANAQFAVLSRPGEAEKEQIRVSATVTEAHVEEEDDDD